MSFAFKITEVETLTRAGLGILGGFLVSGTVKTGSHAELIQGDQHFPVEVKGVVLNKHVAEGESEELRVSVDLRLPGVRQAKAGDLLVSA